MLISTIPTTALNFALRNVLPSVQPGYLSDLLPNAAPEESENWQTIMSDLEKFILPGITHWQSPNFHAFYPLGSSYPSIVADMVTSGFGVLGLSWVSGKRAD